MKQINGPHRSAIPGRGRRLEGLAVLAGALLMGALFSVPALADSQRSATAQRASPKPSSQGSATAQRHRGSARGTVRHHDARRYRSSGQHRGQYRHRYGHRYYRPYYRYRYSRPYYHYRPYYYGHYRHYWGFPWYGGPVIWWHHARHPRTEYGSRTGAVDFDVRPEKAEIHIDGNYVGVADEFDGFPAYLWLEQGTYDVVVYKEGFETIARQITIYPGSTISFDDHMQRGEATRPEDLISKSTENREARERRNRERREAVERAERGEPGRLFVEVQPGDAAVYLDGNFLGVAEELANLSAGLIVPPGEHTLEVVRPGFNTLRRQIRVAVGERTELELSLSPR